MFCSLLELFMSDGPPPKKNPENLDPHAPYPQPSNLHLPHDSLGFYSSWKTVLPAVSLLQYYKLTTKKVLGWNHNHCNHLQKCPKLNCMTPSLPPLWKTKNECPPAKLCTNRVSTAVENMGGLHSPIGGSSSKFDRGSLSQYIAEAWGNLKWCWKIPVNEFTC